MSTEQKVTVRVTRRFAASAERVFDAWLDPANAGKWLFATKTGKVVRCEMDPRAGGDFLIVDRRDGEDVEHIGKYNFVERPRLLVFTFKVPKHWPESSRVTVEIVPASADCELTLTHEGVLAEYASSTQDGWRMILDTLAETIK